MQNYSSLIFSFVALLSLMLSTFVNAATLTSMVNRNQISTNETVTLSVSIDQQVDSSELNLDSLVKNFDILSVRPESRNSITVVNGKSEQIASTKWTITLIPKNEGVLTIPAFTVKSATSQPISLKVSNTPKSNNSTLPLDVEVKLSAIEIYPNQQLIVDVILSASANVRDINGPQLTIENAEVEGFDQLHFQRLDNRIARNVVILKYSVFTSQAGELTIPTMTFTGLEDGRSGIFGSTGTQVIARSKQLKVLVKEPPTGGNHPWFPASEVTISSNWSGDRSKLKTGEPITRRITVTANGQQASVIPPLSQSVLLYGLKSYKDQPLLETIKSSQDFIATRIESEAIVANKPGDYTLPSISIHWWNTKTKQWQTSTLEEQTLNVIGDTTKDVNIIPKITDVTPKHYSAQPDTNKRWQIISALLMLIILIQFTFLTRKHKSASKVEMRSEINHSEQTAWTSLQVAMKSDNIQGIRDNILDWGQKALSTNTKISLTSLAMNAKSQELAQLFNDLDQHLYNGAKKPNKDSLNKLLKQLRETLRRENNHKKRSIPRLNPLYPD